MNDFQFISRRTEYNRNVVVVRVPPGAAERDIVEYAKQVGDDSNPFGCDVRRRADAVEVAFYTD